MNDLNQKRDTKFDDDVNNGFVMLARMMGATMAVIVGGVGFAAGRLMGWW